MTYNFDKNKSRIGAWSYKWASEDILPMWVADMDFEVATPIVEAIKRRANHSIFGYNIIPDEYYSAVINWWDKRHQVVLKKEWIEVSIGVVASLSAVIKGFTKPGDKVIIQSPVYNHFDSSIRNNGCEIVRSSLVYKDNYYTIDFDDFEKKVKDPDAKVFVLCNPHNPVGRIWTTSELKRLSQICLENNVVLVSDEIHRDLAHLGHRYTSVLALDEYRMNSIVLSAPTKAFNLAGLKVSNIITANPEFKKVINRAINDNEVIEPNVFGIEALIAAYESGNEWLDELNVYLENNRKVINEFFSENLKDLKLVKQEATYLLWIDISALGMSADELSDLILKEGKLKLSSGSQFGEEGKHFLRLNYACSKTTLMEGLNRLKYTIDKIS